MSLLTQNVATKYVYFSESKEINNKTLLIYSILKTDLWLRRMAIYEIMIKVYNKEKMYIHLLFTKIIFVV